MIPEASFKAKIVNNLARLFLLLETKIALPDYFLRLSFEVI